MEVPPQVVCTTLHTCVLDFRKVINCTLQNYLQSYEKMLLFSETISNCIKEKIRAFPPQSISSSTLKAARHLPLPLSTLLQ